MNKEFIPYEESLELKELGFNEPCFTWYWDDIGLYNGLEYGNHNKREHVVSAPTYSQAFRFFREKYNLHRHICYFEDTNLWHGDIYKIKTGGLMNNPMELTNYNSYEEAELECLRKLIKLVKNK